MSDPTGIEWIVSRYVSVFTSTFGAMFTVAEIGYYITLYLHITGHNNTVAAKLLDPSIIRMRNKSNSISLIGQVLSWMMEVW